MTPFAPAAEADGGPLYFGELWGSRSPGGSAASIPAAPRAEGGLGSARLPRQALPPSLRGFALGRAGGTGADCGAAVRGSSGGAGGRDASTGAARLSGQRQPRAAPGSPPQPPQPRRPHGGTGTAAQPPGGGHRRASSPARKCPGRGGGGEARGGRESGRRPAPRREPTRSVRERRARPGPAAPARPLSAADGPAQIPHLSRLSPQRRNTPVSPWPLTPRSPQSPRGPPCFLLIREGVSRRSPGPAACRALVALLATCAPLPSPSQRGSSVHASARAVAPTFSRVEHQRDLSFGSFSITIPGMRQQ